MATYAIFNTGQSFMIVTLGRRAIRLLFANCFACCYSIVAPTPTVSQVISSSRTLVTLTSAHDSRILSPLSTVKYFTVVVWSCHASLLRPRSNSGIRNVNRNTGIDDGGRCIGA